MIPTPNNNRTNFYESLNQSIEFEEEEETVVASNVSTASAPSPQNQDQAQRLDRNITGPTKRDPPIASISIAPTNERHQCKISTRAQAWKEIISKQKLQQVNNATMVFDTKRVTRAVELAISDSGATGHFLVEGAPAVNVVPATNPIHILLPNGKRITSTHTCNLDIPWLPAYMTEAHIVPGLSHSSLISTRKFCDAGCKVVFDASECRVYYNNSVVLVGDRDPKTKLWRLPINPRTQTNKTEALRHLDLHIPMHQANIHQASNVYTIPVKQNQLKYMHQSFFNAPIPTLLKAVAKGHLKGIPLMKADLITKYLAKSPATSKGRMKRPRVGIRSTRKPSDTEAKSKNEEHVIPINDIREVLGGDIISQGPNIIRDDYESSKGANNIFCYAALADTVQRTLYTDAM